MYSKILIPLMVILAGKSHAQPEIPTETSLQKHCLALNIYHEARGENKDSDGNPVDSYENWLVVAMITRNRIDNEYYPHTWCKVVYQPFQYSWTHDGKPDEPDLSKEEDRRAWEEINVFVEGFLANHRHIKDPTYGS